MAWLLHADFLFALPRGWKYVLYIINTVIGKTPIKIIPHYFCGYCSNVQHFTTLKNLRTLSLIFCTFIGYRSLPCLSALFSDLCPYIINDFLLPFSQYSNFFNAMHTYSLITISRQIRASAFDVNSF